MGHPLAPPPEVTKTLFPTTTDNIKIIEDIETSSSNKQFPGFQIEQNLRDIKINKTKDSLTVTTTEAIPETTFLPSEETTILKLETTTYIELPKHQTTFLKPFKQYSNSESSKTSFEQKPTLPQTTLLIPGGQQPSKKMATITKVPSPNMPSASARLRSEYDALPPMAHNREPKKIPPVLQTEATKEVELQTKDMSWYFATYNSTESSCYASVHESWSKEISIVYIFILWVSRNYLLLV